ncbi:MAG: tRNA (guanosine(46)-N7)-methyltransferase TrmB [Candidatus Planktophila sp.]|nr:tRNA (guanosine(46)-N7)-methyltransferase TrmB [Candidatus Planktophila sp.]MBP7805498.1 tRNA (guanosine(46)-N7)-methyltransferase TrmB [Candidatus Planktophila sp.]
MERQESQSSGIKSFRLRGKRMTRAQNAALIRSWDRFGIEFGTTVDTKALFPNAKEVIIEIGFGMGDATAEIAKAHPENGYIAIEVHPPGIGKLLSLIEEHELTNVYIIEGDAIEILQTMFADHSINGFHLFFPDPWPKLKHNKRRIVNSEFLALIHQKLIAGGYINIATDWVPYAEWIKDVFASSDQFTGEEVARPDWRPYTKFEGKGLAKDHRVSDFHYKAKV